MTDALVIVGSRLQALIFAVAAIGIPLGGWDRVGLLTLLVAAALALAAALTLHRRVELYPERVVVRHRFRSATTMARRDVSASTGHRYLRLDGPHGSIRIEVPVEIRPDVRAWAAGA